jgi:hypothetical protein
MIPRRTFFFVCLVISTLCLAAGYTLVGQWLGVLLAILTGPAWWLARKYPVSWLPLICLLGSVCLAVVGLLIGSSPLLMICGSGVALAVWDLLFLEAALGSNPSEGQTRQYENKHLQSLALALGFGLSVAILGRLQHLQLPFVLLMLFITLALFGLDRVLGTIKKRRGTGA